MEGMYDIIPPAPVDGALVALIGQGGLPPGLMPTLIVLLSVLAAALWLGRKRLRAAIRRRRALAALRAGRIQALEALIRRHSGRANLHPAHPPRGVDAHAWRGLIEGLHAARFGHQPLDHARLRPTLAQLFTHPSGHASGGLKKARSRREVRP